jgi:uncharacterized protein (DUF1499 family)
VAFRLDDFTPPMTWNWALIAPAGRTMPGAMRQAPAWPVPVERLREVVLAAAKAEPRCALLHDNRGEARLEFRARSRLFGFPDLISVALVEADGGSSLALFSRAKLGGYDFGVNRRRAKRWLKRIDLALQ